MATKGSQEGYVFRNVEEVVMRKDVGGEVGKLRTMWNIPEGGFDDYIIYENWLSDLVSTKSQRVVQVKVKGLPSRYSDFLNDVSKMTRKLKLARHWDVFFRNYVTRNLVIDNLKLRSGRHKYSPKIYLRKQIVEGDERQTILIEIDANTKKPDIDKIWREVRKIQKQMPNYSDERKKRKLERNLIIIDELDKFGKKTLSVGDVQKMQDAIFDDIELDSQAKAIRRTRKILDGR